MVIFGRQEHHSGSHFTGLPPLPLPFSISQNPAKDQALAASPPITASQNKKSQLSKKDTIFGAARKNFGPSYFVTALEEL